MLLWDALDILSDAFDKVRQDPEGTSWTMTEWRLALDDFAAEVMDNAEDGVGGRATRAARKYFAASEDDLLDAFGRIGHGPLADMVDPQATLTYFSRDGFQKVGDALSQVVEDYADGEEVATAIRSLLGLKRR